MAHPFLSVVIPAYNEEVRITQTLETLVDYLRRQSYSWEVVVADDGSEDGTAGLVLAAANENPGIRLVSLSHRGKGWAVKAGMMSAQGRYRFIADADLSMPIEHLERFLPPTLSDFDIAIGSREAPGSRRFHEPFRRHLMGRRVQLDGEAPGCQGLLGHPVRLQVLRCRGGGNPLLYAARPRLRLRCRGAVPGTEAWYADQGTYP